MFKSKDKDKGKDKGKEEDKKDKEKPSKDKEKKDDKDNEKKTDAIEERIFPRLKNNDPNLTGLRIKLIFPQVVSKFFKIMKDNTKCSSLFIQQMTLDDESGIIYPLSSASVTHIPSRKGNQQLSSA